MPPEGVEEPSMFDVLMGRSGYCYNHVGNQSFRTLIDDNLGWYTSVMKGRKREKIAVVSFIMNTIELGGGRFLRQNAYDRLWYDVDYKIAREKVSHALRDHLFKKPVQVLCKEVEPQRKSNEYSDEWRNLVLKTAALNKDRDASVIPTVQRREPWVQPTDAQGISDPKEDIAFNHGRSLNEDYSPHSDADRNEISLAESRKWFRSFVRDTFNESTQTNIGAASRPVDPHLRSYIGSGLNTPRASSTYGSSRDSILLNLLSMSPERFSLTGYNLPRAHPLQEKQVRSQSLCPFRRISNQWDPETELLQFARAASNHEPALHRTSSLPLWSSSLMTQSPTWKR